MTYVVAWRDYNLAYVVGVRNWSEYYCTIGVRIMDLQNLGSILISTSVKNRPMEILEELLTQTTWFIPQTIRYWTC
jgi:hypothetical protein